MSERVKLREPLLTRVDTGSVSYKAYGTAVRAVQQTRGNRQGNQAFFIANNFLWRNFIVKFMEESLMQYITEDLWKTYSLATKSHHNPLNQFY